MARNLSLQYDIRVKELEEQNWGCSNTKVMKKKNIIEFCEVYPERLLERSTFSKISDNRQSYGRIVVMQSWIFSLKAIITRMSMLFLSRKISSIRGVISVIAQRELHSLFQKFTWSRSNLSFSASSLSRWSEIPRRGILQRYVEILWLFAARSETINPEYWFRTFISKILITCHVDHFPTDSYKKVIAHVSRKLFLR